MGRLLAPGSARALLICTVLFVAERGLEATGSAPPPLRFWLDDSLMLPLALGAALVLHRLRGRSPAWTLPTGQVLTALVLVSTFFEIVLPGLDSRATGDPLDVGAYAVGAGGFLLWINRPAEENA